MASPFDNIGSLATNSARDAQSVLNDKVAEAKAKKEELSKTIETSLGGLKAMIGSRGVFKGAFGDPTVEKYIAQTKGNIRAGIEKAGKKAVEAVKNKFTSSAGAQANPSAVESMGARATASGTSQEGAGGLSEEATDAFAARLSATAERGVTQEVQDTASVLQNTTLSTGEEAIAPELEEEEGAAEASDISAGATRTLTTFGDGQDLDDGEFDSDVDDDEMDNTSNATEQPKDADDDGEEDEDEDEDEEPPKGTNADQDVKDVDADLDDDAVDLGADAGTDAAIGGGEAFLAGLDAIPGLDVFTMIAGAALGIGAAAAKRKPIIPVIPPIDEAHTAFQAGFSQV